MVIVKNKIILLPGKDVYKRQMLGILYIDYLENGVTITGEYYSNLLETR